MHKAVIVAVAAAALVLGAAAPATAAPGRSVPQAPVSVSVRGADDTATMSWRAPVRSAPITGWIVSAKPVDQRRDHDVAHLQARVRSYRSTSLTPGTTYAFSVRATNTRGSSKAVSVRYTVPAVAAPDVPALYGLDAAGNVVRFATDGSTASSVVAPNGVGYTADRQGDVFVPSPDGTSITWYPRDGRTPGTVKAGLHVSPDLRNDDTGNLYWADSTTGAVTELSTAGVVTTVPGLGTPGSLFAVAGNGAVATFRHASSGDVLTVRTAAGAVTTRTLNGNGPFPSGRADAMSIESDGDVYIHSWTVGASGYNTWYLLPLGVTEPTRLSDRTAFEIGALTRDGFALVESKQWCAAPAEYPKPCAIDRSFSDELVRSGTITTAETVTGITAVDRAPVFGAADDAGDVFADIPAGPTPGLWRLPAGGGAAQQLSADQFTRLIAV